MYFLLNVRSHVYTHKVIELDISIVSMLMISLSYTFPFLRGTACNTMRSARYVKLGSLGHFLPPVRP